MRVVIVQNKLCWLHPLERGGFCARGGEATCLRLPTIDILKGTHAGSPSGPCAQRREQGSTACASEPKKSRAPSWSDFVIVKYVATTHLVQPQRWCAETNLQMAIDLEFRTVVQQRIRKGKVRNSTGSGSPRGSTSSRVLHLVTYSQVFGFLSAACWAGESRPCGATPVASRRTSFPKCHSMPPGGLSRVLDAHFETYQA